MAGLISRVFGRKGKAVSGEPKRLEVPGWVYYIAEAKAEGLDPTQTGKWMSFFGPDGARLIDEAAYGAVRSGVVAEAKRTSDEALAACGTGACCFYLNGDDAEGHRGVLRYMADKGLIRRTKTGKLFNISFKYDEQTDAGEYGETFHPKICLSDFMDPVTGEFRP